MGKQWKVWKTILGGSKIIADGNCSHEIKRYLLFGRKVMTNLDSILKNRDITLLTKVHLVKVVVFPVVMYGCESCATGGKAARHNFQKNDKAQGHNINWLEPNGTKMADNTRPWYWISKWNDTPRGALTVPVQFSHSVVSDSLWPHWMQHTRPPCPSPTPRVYSNSSPLSQWCHLTISSSVIPFSSCLQSFPASGAFQMSQFFTSGGQRIGASASASVLPVNIQDWFPLAWTGWICLQSEGLSRVFSNTTVQKHQFFGPQPSLWSNSQIHTWLLENP